MQILPSFTSPTCSSPPFGARGRSTLTVHERAISLMEAILGLTIMLGVMATTALMLNDQRESQQEAVSAESMGIILRAAQNYVQANYDTLLNELAGVATTTGAGIRSQDIDVVTDAGFLPPAFLNDGSTASNLWDQRYALLSRIVLNGDTTNPPATVTGGQIAGAGGLGTNNIPDAWEDDILDAGTGNDELGLEILLVTYDGEEIDPNRGNPIAVLAGPDAGFVRVADSASGPYGAWTIDLTPYSGLSEYPSEGHFASLVSLSGYGPILSGEVDLRPYLNRCEGLTGATLQDCLNSPPNEVYGSVVFQQDQDGDGVDETPTVIQGLSEIECPPGTVTASVGILLIDCPTTRTSGQLIVDTDVNIGNNLQVANGAGVGGDLTVNGNGAFGADVSIAQDLAVTGDATVQGGVWSNDGFTTPGDLDVGGDARFGNDIDVDGDAAIDGQMQTSQAVVTSLHRPGETLRDISEGVYDVIVAESGDSIAKPTCPPQNAEGFLMAPRIYVSTMSAADFDGRPIVGTRTFATDTGPNWQVRMLNFVGQDVFTNDTANPPGRCTESGLTTTNWRFCADVNGDGVIAGDGQADVYEVDGGYGKMMVVVRCF
ncbi:hypothetical protein [Amorphus sp. 3PC139-8]|uniref:hypothetical protein n=1 Tax=Amorphus sp. 3PC139-8 TaxID=2735676 RepID=UPI00345D8A74